MTQSNGVGGSKCGTVSFLVYEDSNHESKPMHSIPLKSWYTQTYTFLWLFTPPTDLCTRYLVAQIKFLSSRSFGFSFTNIASGSIPEVFLSLTYKMNPWIDRLDLDSRSLVDQYLGTGWDADEFVVPTSRFYSRYRHPRVLRPSSWVPDGRDGTGAERNASKDIFSVSNLLHILLF